METSEVKNTIKKNQKRDVGWCAKKYTNEDLKVKVNIPIKFHLFTIYSEDVGMGLCIFTFTFRSSLVLKHKFS